MLFPEAGCGRVSSFREPWAATARPLHVGAGALARSRSLTGGTEEAIMKALRLALVVIVFAAALAPAPDAYMT